MYICIHGTIGKEVSRYDIHATLKMVMLCELTQITHSCAQVVPSAAEHTEQQEVDQHQNAQQGPREPGSVVHLTILRIVART